MSRELKGVVAALVIAAALAGSYRLVLTVRPRPGSAAVDRGVLSVRAPSRTP